MSTPSGAKLPIKSPTTTIARNDQYRSLTSRQPARRSSAGRMAPTRNSMAREPTTAGGGPLLELSQLLVLAVDRDDLPAVFAGDRPPAQDGRRRRAVLVDLEPDGRVSRRRSAFARGHARGTN